MPSNRVPTTSPRSAFQEGSLKHSPIEQVRVLFVRFIQGLFNTAPTGAYHWEPDETTEILITDENPLKVENIGQRPAITITRGALQFYTLGLDDMLVYDPRTGSKVKSVLVPGTMTINCCSRVDLECERLAWICAEQLWANRELLMKAGFFEVGRQPTIGAPSPAGSIVAGDSGDEWYCVAVTCPFQFYRTTKITPLGKRIVQGINVALRAAVRPVGSVNSHGCDVPRTSGADLPYAVEGCFPPSFSDASDVNGNTPNPGEDAPSLPRVPHPFNPAQTVSIRSSRPNCPAVRPPSIGGRTLPISTPTVEESCGNQVDVHVTDTSTIKV